MSNNIYLLYTYFCPVGIFFVRALSSDLFIFCTSDLTRISFRSYQCRTIFISCVTNFVLLVFFRSNVLKQFIHSLDYLSRSHIFLFLPVSNNIYLSCNYFCPIVFFRSHTLKQFIHASEIRNARNNFLFLSVSNDISLLYRYFCRVFFRCDIRLS
jgi:hypothetical protein